jgi:hypothetical protein
MAEVIAAGRRIDTIEMNIRYQKLLKRIFKSIDLMTESNLSKPMQEMK